MVFVSIVMESQLFKSLGSSQGNTWLCFLLFWFQYCLSLQKMKPLYTSPKKCVWGGGGGEENKAVES